MTARSVSVAVLLTSFRGGGAEKAMVRLANGLSGRAFEIELLVVDSEGPNKQLVSSSVKTIEWNKGSVSKCLLDLKNYLVKSKPDVVITTGLHACVILSIAHLIARSKAKIVAREALPLSIELKQGRILRILSRFFYPRFDAMVSMTECQADDRRGSIKPSQKTHQLVIPNSVDWDLIRALRTQPMLPSLQEGYIDKPYILAMGRLIEQKQFEILIEAFASLKDRIPHNLIILGDGQLREELLQLSVELGIEHRVWLAGYTVNPYPFLEHADLYVLCSEFEGMPNALIDAVAMGKAIVATDCKCGPREVLNGVDYSRIVPVGDVETLKCEMEASIYLIDDANAGDVIRHPVPDFWKVKFSENQVISSYETMIKTLCETNSHAIGQKGI